MLDDAFGSLAQQLSDVLAADKKILPSASSWRSKPVDASARPMLRA
jgi:hypothetical protein